MHTIIAFIENVNKIMFLKSTIVMVFFHINFFIICLSTLLFVQMDHVAKNIMTVVLIYRTTPRYFYFYINFNIC